MPGTNFILPFCSTDSGTNLLTQNQYQADAQRSIGHQTGIARSVLANKAARQAAAMAAGLGQFIADGQADNVTDNLTPAQIAAMIILAVRAAVNANIVASEFPANTALLFLQASAPAHWVQDTTEMANGRSLHIVADNTGGASGGLHNPSVCNVVAAHTHSLTTGGQSAAHSHVVTDPGHHHDMTTLPNIPPTGQSTPYGLVAAMNETNTTVYTTSMGTATTGISIGNSSGDHTHSGSTDSGSSSTNWQPKYTNAILCRKA